MYAMNETRTVVVAGVVAAQKAGEPIAVPAAGFVRDTLFFMAGLLLVGLVGIRGEVTVWAALALLLLYAAYVYSVLWLDRYDDQACTKQMTPTEARKTVHSTPRTNRPISPW